MLAHHDADLNRALDQLAVEGSVTIRWEYLYIWFNTSRIAVGAYREILKRWEDLCTKTWEYATAPKLTVMNTNASLVIFRDVFAEEEEKIEPLESRT
jgi:hypothetical protein